MRNTIEEQLQKDDLPLILIYSLREPYQQIIGPLAQAGPGQSPGEIFFG